MAAWRSAHRLALALAAALLAGAALVPPMASYLYALRHAQGSLEAEAGLVAQQVNELVTSNPDLWRFEQIRLEELLQRRLRSEPAARRVLDQDGRVVAESVDPLPSPRVSRGASVLDAGHPAGRVEITYSLRPAVQRAALLALLLCPLAALAFLSLSGALRRAASARRELEARLRQAHRLEAIGRLAGGVAHDFNNLLAAVLGYARELREELPPDAPQQELVGEILAVSKRGVQVTRSLLAFSRHQALALAGTDAGQLVRELAGLLRSTLGSGLELELDLAPAPLPVRVDAVQVEMVLVNLVANARDATPPGGRVKVATSRLEVSPGEAAALGLARPGPHVRIAVADSGAGMDVATRERVFDPFFTTKEVGRGTGLGLAIAHGVVEQHQGAIGVASAPGQGTTFTLLFPLAPAAQDQDQDEDEDRAGDPPPGAPPGGGETLLLAEDDRHVARAARRVLEGAGYTVVRACDGAEAVRRFAEHRDEIRLLVLDLQLPGRTGPQVLAEVRGLAPGVPALFVSGRPPEAGSAGAAELAGHPVLSKPVEPVVLLRAVRRALDGSTRREVAPGARPC